MFDIRDLLQIADEYKTVAGLDRDSTVSHRVFGDSKKLSALRDGAQLTVGRFNDAVIWFDVNWPDGANRPSALTKFFEQGEAA